MVPQRRVFVCASELALDESLVISKWGCVPPRKKSKYDRSSWRVGLLQCSHSLRSRVVERARKRRRVQWGSATEK
ncbi:hypothetical protein BHM03_00058780 [Ensete ventricosum]|uniref:Uncharacterized protein n=1 Tax=Ensete ventricosum TaxID=4639 RepID=A0A445MML7_ENSVE|nr:hypothetical protein BHM03_00058780 [Ensete ventricosum]